MTTETIQIVWGEEHYGVANYSGFRVGPFSITVIIRENETPDQAFNRGWAILESHATLMFIAKRNGFHERYGARL